MNWLLYSTGWIINQDMSSKSLNTIIKEILKVHYDATVMNNKTNCMRYQHRYSPYYIYYCTTDSGCQMYGNCLI